ncbi:MAG: ABC transporter ATP-binding protein [Chloroflexota bacterium]|nr:ABC transporter ATP-binding protein [Chloroflexota bacterium]
MRVCYGDRVALEMPLLHLGEAETLSLIGPNGAGKSTLLQVAALLRRPDVGEVLIRGERATRRSTSRLRRRIAVVFQDPLLFDVRVLANVAAGLRFRGVSRRDAERTAAAWLARFDVGHLADRHARALSGGEAQRVSLARAFATDPEILLLDEPFAALDAPTRSTLVPELRAQLRATGTSAIIVTHDQAEALSLGDRLGVVLGGRVGQLGPPADVLARPASVAVAAFLGVANLIPVRVVSVTGQRLEVATERDGPCIAIHAAGDPGFRVGQQVTLALHARHVTLQPPGAAAPAGRNALNGLVADASLTPAGQEVAVLCGPDMRLIAAAPILPDRSPWSPGQPVTVGIDPAAAHLIANPVQP